jgi:cytochrome c553
MSNRLAFIAVAAAVALASVPSSVHADAPAKASVAKVDWKDMNYKQKKDFMKKSVMPTMKPIFHAFDAKKFKTFECVTCHGSDGPDRKFKMPSKDIAPLPGTPEAFQAKMKKEPDWPKWTQFMSEKVVPAMGKLLNVAVFDPRNPVEGAFSCGACHKIEKP